MNSLRITSLIVACTGAAIAAGCSSSQLLQGENGTLRPLVESMSAVQPSTSAITFDPASPLTLALNATVYVTVSETGYHGSYKIAGCSAKLPVHCTPVRYGKACYENYTPDQINSISATIYNGSHTITMANYAAGTYFPKITCHFKVKDSLGNSATYTVTSP